MRRIVLAFTALLTLGLQAPVACAQAATVPKMALVPMDKDNDLKLYLVDGRIVNGAEAMQRMQEEA